MCIRQHSAPLSATTPAISRSARSALTSLTRLAPAASAARATAALDVSIEICAGVPSSTRPATTGTTRRSSSPSVTGSAPGRVDSPPMSRISAPSAVSERACSIAAPASRNAPPSENESGVTFTIPIRRYPWLTCRSLRPGALRGAIGRSAMAHGARPGKPSCNGARSARGALRVACANLRGAAGEAGARDRAGRFALGAVDSRGRGGQLGLGLLLHAERLLLALAGEQREKLLLLDRLTFDEDLGHLGEVALVFCEDARRALVGHLDDAANLIVDFAGDFVGVVGLGGELAAEERLAVVVAEDARAELLAHPEAHDHLLGRRGHLLDVVGGAGADLPKDDLLGRAAAERHRHRVLELGARGQEAVLLGHGDRVPERLPARDHGDLVHGVGVLEEVADEGVAHLVEGSDQALFLAHHARLLLGAGDHAHDPLLELFLADLALARAGRQERGLE